jgi:hypothetical protein
MVTKPLDELFPHYNHNNNVQNRAKIGSDVTHAERTKARKILKNEGEKYFCSPGQIR